MCFRPTGIEEKENGVLGLTPMTTRYGDIPPRVGCGVVLQPQTANGTRNSQSFGFASHIARSMWPSRRCVVSTGPCVCGRQAAPATCVTLNEALIFLITSLMKLVLRSCRRITGKPAVSRKTLVVKNWAVDSDPLSTTGVAQPQPLNGQTAVRMYRQSVLPLGRIGPTWSMKSTTNGAS
jgi:hypothetical protein